MKLPNTILMCPPTHFKVDYEINPFMDKNNPIDEKLAFTQWTRLKEVYEDLGLNVKLIEPSPELPDMVFMANQLVTLPNKRVLFSRMCHPQRMPEVSLIIDQIQPRDFFISAETFEGTGDFIWDIFNGRCFLGHGKRTKKSAYEQFEEDLSSFECIYLNLISDHYYHLDTCLCVIDENTCLFAEDAFDQDSIQKIKGSFHQSIALNQTESLRFLACNAHSVDGKNIIVEQGAKITQGILEKLGKNIISINTSEFLKSGGSIFCLKNHAWF
ncbi:MAG: hypothetical protein CME61_07205 [Halobacteriovoraceae bacterium]|nr:hypothetical protein [Halobacteriovoraceae bacterium]